MPIAVLIAEAVEAVRPGRRRRRASRCTSPPSIPDAAVPCDRRQVLSALTNLLDNAIKYSESPSAVEIARIAVGRHGHDHRDATTVPGIPSRDLERIFERFYRVDRARSRATGGTGLGLSIVRHVAQAHGGDVTVESREGEGSTFRLRLAQVVNGGASPAGYLFEERR